MRHPAASTPARLTLLALFAPSWVLASDALIETLAHAIDDDVEVTGSVPDNTLLADSSEESSSPDRDVQLKIEAAAAAEKDADNARHSAKDARHAVDKARTDSERAVALEQAKMLESRAFSAELKAERARKAARNATIRASEKRIKGSR